MEANLILSGDNPSLDFIGFDFNYGIVNLLQFMGQLLEIIQLISE